VTLHVDRFDPDAVVDTALVDVPGGETASFHVRTTVRTDPEALTRSPVLRTANDVVVPRAPRTAAGAARDLESSR
jgi:beta-mannosidase